MAGVTMLNSDFENIVTPASGATEVAQDNFGVSLVAFRPVSGGHTTVGVTAYVGSDATQSGDWGKVIVNAGNWLISGPCGSPSPTADSVGNALSDAYVPTGRFARAMDTGSAGRDRPLRRLHGQRWHLCL